MNSLKNKLKKENKKREKSLKNVMSVWMARLRPLIRTENPSIYKRREFQLPQVNRFLKFHSNTRDVGRSEAESGSEPDIYNVRSN